MKSIKFIALIISILALLSSCSEHPEKDKSRTKRRTVELHFNVYTQRYYVLGDSITSVRFIDTLYKQGDVINLNGNYYKIIN